MKNTEREQFKGNATIGVSLDQQQVRFQPFAQTVDVSLLQLGVCSYIS